MKVLLGVALLAFAAGAGLAQEAPEPAAAPGLAVLLYHPYPDSADPLGFPFSASGGRDAFAARYGFLVADAGAFPYPYAVIDGVHPVAGLPDETRPYQATLEAYDAAVRERAAAEAPLVLTVASARSLDVVEVALEAAPKAPLDRADLRLWAALAEDHVRFRPPAALSNGVFDHRFTVRALADLGPVDASSGAPTQAAHAFRLDPGWDDGTLFVAAWVQQGAAEGRFQPHEVVQSILQQAGEAPLRQSSKGVLLEMLSATWCDTCLYGDQAAAALATAHGVPDLAPRRDAPTYFRAPAEPWLAAGGSALAAAATLAWTRRRP